MIADFYKSWGHSSPGLSPTLNQTLTAFLTRHGSWSARRSGTWKLMETTNVRSDLPGIQVNNKDKVFMLKYLNKMLIVLKYILVIINIQLLIII